MTSVAEHYAHHLGPIYVWMAGGPEAALKAGTAEIEALNLPLTARAVVLDLGAGFGMHSIPLARRGARVTAIDTSSELLRAQVPNLLLQPLVENTIKHGIAKRIAGGTVRIVATRQNDALLLTIHNDGPVLPADWQPTQIGVGIGNLRTRLQILHGEKSGLQLRPASGGGVEVIVNLPFTEK